MVDLQKIRDEYNKRPLEGTAPADIEKKYARRDNDELYADPQQCIVENCNALSFMGQPRCKRHHLEWCASIDQENEKTQKEVEKYLKSKKGQEESAMSKAKAINTHCNDCGVYLRFSDRHVVPKSKRPKRPDYPHQIYKVVCQDCK